MVYLEQTTILSIITAKNFIFDLYQENYTSALTQLIFALSMKMYHQTGYSTKPLFVIATLSSLYSTMENGRDFINLREKSNQQYVEELKNDSFMTDDYHNMLQQHTDELETKHPNDQSIPAHDEL